MNGPRFSCALIVLALLSTAIFPLITLADGPEVSRSGSRAGLSGFVESSQGLPQNLEYATVGVGRFNNDNNPDIASGLLSWYHVNYGLDTWTNNNGAQSWTKQDTGLPTTGGYGQITVGDINNDNFDEIVAPHENAWSQGGASGIKVYKSDGAASPTFSAMTAPIASGAWDDVSLGDIDKDGFLDIAASSENAGVKVWKGDGGTTWTDTSTGLPTTGQYYGVAFGDMDEDGNLDLVAAGNGGGVRLYKGNGGTSWTQATGTGLPTGQWLDVNISDVDNDNNLDIVVGGYQGGIHVYTGNGGQGGTMTFTQESDILPTTGFYGQIAVGDVDLDGNKDIWTGEAYGGGMRLYLGDGAATGSCKWTRYSTNLPANGPYSGAMMADLDLDGDLDLIASDSGLNSGGSVGIRVFLASVSTVNAAPKAKAGVDQTVLLGTKVHLDASNSTDSDGTVTGWLWNITAAPTGNTAQFDCSTAKQPVLEAQKIGKYEITLAVKDNKGKWGLGEAKVNITVNPLPNKRPVANAGADKTVTLLTLVQLNGSLSTDEEGITAYNWNITGKPTDSNITLSDETVMSPTFTPDYIGQYKFTLTVKDVNNSWSKDDEIKITANPAGTGPPLANAGMDQTIELGSVAVLSGMASSDDQMVIAYEWTIDYQPSGSSITVQNVALQNITPTHEGYYDFSLRVKDNDNLWSTPDTMRIVVLPMNLPPVAQIDKPADDAVFLDTDIIDFDGSASSDPEGKSITLIWTSSLDGELYPDPQFTTNLSVGKHTIALSVTDDHDHVVTANVHIEIKRDTIPTAMLSATPTKILKGEKVNFDAKASSDKEGVVAEYQYDFGDSSPLTWLAQPTNSHVYKAAGTYKASVKVKDNKGLISNSSELITINVGEIPTAAVSADLPVIKVNKPITVNAGASKDNDGTIVSYYYDFGDTTNSGWVNDTSMAHTYTKAGDYTITVKVRDNDGYESTNSAIVKVTVQTVKKPNDGGLGSMLPILLIVVVLVVVIAIVAAVMMKRKKGPAATVQPGPTQGTSLQPDLMAGSTAPTPTQDYQTYDPNQYQQPAYDPNAYAQPQYDPSQQTTQVPPNGQGPQYPPPQ